MAVALHRSRATHRSDATRRLNITVPGSGGTPPPDPAPPVDTTGLGLGRTVVDLGAPLRANTLYSHVMWQTSGGATHLTVFYSCIVGYYFSYQAVDIHLESGTTRLLAGTTGLPGANGKAMVGDKLYVGSNDGASGKSYLWEYTPATGAARQVGQLASKTSQWMTAWSDNIIWIGLAVDGKLDSYNPATDTITHHGVMASAASSGSTIYVYTIGVDSDYVYCGIGQIPWYLTVYNRATAAKVSYWDTAGDTAGFIYKAAVGTTYYYNRRTSAGANLWYRLENGAPTLIANTAVPALQAFDILPGGVINGTTSKYASVFGYNVDLGLAYPDSGNNGTAIFKWKTTSASVWQSATVSSGFTLVDQLTRRAYVIPGDTTRLACFVDSYGPVYDLHLGTLTATTLGRPQYSLYDAVITTDARWYLGYANATLHYDPDEDWNLTDSTLVDTDASVNPRKLATSNGKYHYFGVAGSDGLIYVACQHERDSVGSELVWYDPVTLVKGGPLRTPLASYDPRSLCSAVSGAKIVLACTNISGADGKLVIFDVATKTVEREIGPLPGTAYIGAIAEVESGFVVGIADTTAYKINITTGVVVWTVALTSTPWSGMRQVDKRLVNGPDGYLWFPYGTALARINPANGAIQQLLTLPAVSNVLFSGVDAYLYGTTKLYTVASLLA